MNIFAHIVAVPVRAYRLIFSPWVGFNCRYQPTCSAYALEALEKHGALKGSWLTTPSRRIVRQLTFSAPALSNASRSLADQVGWWR